MFPFFIMLLGLLQATRVPVPDATQQKEREKVVRETFKTEYARKAPAERLAFAKLLLQQAMDTKDDPATQYVVLREARDIAVSVGDTNTAMEAITRIAQGFEVSALGMKLGVLTAMLQASNTPEASKQTIGALLNIADEAEEVEDIETEEKAVATAFSGARKSKDMSLISRAETKQREVAQVKAKLLKARAAREVLATNPEDPASNLELGQYLCFIKGDWDAGLPLLAKGSNEPQKVLALTDLSKPESVADQIGLGDSWKDLADKEVAYRARIRERAVFWYEKAITIASGLLKVKVEKKLTELAGSSYAGGARGREVSPDGLVGWWKFDEGFGALAQDASGHHHGGRISGGTDWVPGHLGNALRLGGVDGRILVADDSALRISGEITISCWFRKEAAPQDWARLIGKGTRDARNYGLWLGGQNQSHCFMFQQWDESKHEVVVLNGRTACESGKWYHVAAVVRGDLGILYVDGSEESSKKRSGPPVTSSDPLIFGFPSWNQPVSGTLDDVRIYKRGLTEAEIKVLAAMK